MCNIYQISTQKGSSQGGSDKIAAAVWKLPSARVPDDAPGFIHVADS